MPAALCSTGEQKALLIAIVLAHARLLGERGTAPLLLLDEVAAHLDEERRAALFDDAAGAGRAGLDDRHGRGACSPLGRLARFFRVGATPRLERRAAWTTDQAT